VHDRHTGSTQRVSISSNSEQGNYSSEYPSISADGRYVVFFSFASNLVDGDTNDCAGISCSDIFIHDRKTGTTDRVSVSTNGDQGNSNSFYPFISASGRYVAFQSFASNLVSEDTNNAMDIFVNERETKDFIFYLPLVQNRP
jgi:Tol biopolymer transport system component